MLWLSPVSHGGLTDPCLKIGRFLVYGQPGQLSSKLVCHCPPCPQTLRRRLLPHAFPALSQPNLKFSTKPLTVHVIGRWRFTNKKAEPNPKLPPNKSTSKRRLPFAGHHDAAITGLVPLLKSKSCHNLHQLRQHRTSKNPKARGPFENSHFPLATAHD
jgi:hypothetical protein